MIFHNRKEADSERQSKNVINTNMTDVEGGGGRGESCANTRYREDASPDMPACQRGQNHGGKETADPHTHTRPSIVSDTGHTLTHVLVYNPTPQRRGPCVNVL